MPRNIYLCLSTDRGTGTHQSLKGDRDAFLFLFHEHPHEESHEFVYPLWFVAWIVKVAVLCLFPLEVDGIAEVMDLLF